MKTNKFLFLTVGLVIICSNVKANEQSTIINQNEETVSDKAIDQSVNDISNILEKNLPLPTTKETVEDVNDAWNSNFDQKSQLQKANFNNIRSESFFRDLGIVQKNILNKTGRIQLFGGITLVPTDVYFRTLGGQINVGYHFNESYGLNLFGYIFESFRRDEIRDVENNQGVRVDSLLFLKNYYGASFYWNKIYGKMTLFNKRIYQFEMFFNLGGGMINTRTSSNSPGIHIGIGNLYTLSQDSALRFDLNWVFYQAKNLRNETQNSNSLLLTVGYSGFFLEGIVHE